MEQYDFNSAKYGTHNLVAEELGESKTILDVGCNKGYLKRLAPTNFFYGIDNDRNDLETAKIKQGYVETFEMNLNEYANFKTDKKFDVIVFSDILEHLVFPQKVLEYFTKNYLNQGGKVIVSLPNVANFSTRLDLLLGKFDYMESGILDRTHLHLYTLKTARELMKKCGLKVIEEKFSSNNFGGIIKFMPIFGSLLGYNLIFIAKKDE